MPRTMEEQVAAWFAARAAEDPVGELRRLEALNGTRPDFAHQTAVARRCYRLFREGAQPFERHGWRVATNRMVRRSPAGNWARIGISRDAWAGSLELMINCEIHSGQLLTSLDRRDPDVEPPAGLKVIPHLIPVAGYRVNYTPGDAPPTPRPLPVPSSYWDSEPRTLLGPATARAWMAASLGAIAEAAMRWSETDLVLRDALLDLAGERQVAYVRRAALLTRHLGRDDELPAIVDRAEAAYRALAAAVADSGVVHEDHNRSRDIGEWSHARFVQYLRAC